MIAPLFRNILPEIWHPTLLRRNQVFPAFFYDVSSKLQLFPELLPDFGLLYIWEAFQIEEYSTPTKSAYLNGGDRTRCVSHCFKIHLCHFKLSNPKEKVSGHDWMRHFRPIVFTSSLFSAFPRRSETYKNNIPTICICIDYQAVPSGYITTWKKQAEPDVSSEGSSLAQSMVCM